MPVFCPSSGQLTATWSTEPALEPLIDLYPWNPSVALFRALEWRAVFGYSRLFSSPVLDLGCGDGSIGRLFLGDRDIVGIDLNQKPLGKAKILLKKVVQADARHLPFRDGVLGSIFSNCAMEHFPDLDTCLAAIARVLRPGGILIATVPGLHWKTLYFWNRFFLALGLRHFGQQIVDAHDRRACHYNIFGPMEWTARLQKAGLEPIEFGAYLTPRQVGYFTLVDSLLALPLPIWRYRRPYGLYFFIGGVLRRIGGEGLWKGLFMKRVRELYCDRAVEGTVHAGLVVVARKPLT